MKSNVSTFFR